MQTLGIRTSPASIRYAVIEWEGPSATFVNSDSENKLDFPKECRNIEQKLHWLHQELERILRQYPRVEKIVIKSNEYGPDREKASSREAAYLDATVLMIAGQNAIPVDIGLYRNIGTRRNEVKSFVESKVGVSNKYWNEQIADAVAAGLSGRGN